MSHVSRNLICLQTRSDWLPGTSCPLTVYTIATHYNTSKGIVQNSQVDCIGRFCTDPGFTTWEAKCEDLVNHKDLLTWLHYTTRLSTRFMCRLTGPRADPHNFRITVSSALPNSSTFLPGPVSRFSARSSHRRSYSDKSLQFFCDW